MGLYSAKQGKAGADPAAQGGVWAEYFEGPALPKVHLYCGGAGGDHNPSPEQVFSKCLIFSTEGKADLHLKSQTFKTRGPERETISSHKLNVCSKLPFPESQGFGALHAPAGPCLSASLVGRQTTQTSVMMSKQTLMNFGARLVLAFMGHKNHPAASPRADMPARQPRAFTGRKGPPGPVCEGGRGWGRLPVHLPITYKPIFML